MSVRDHITVKFFEKNQSEPFAASEMPLDQLPDRFDRETMLQIGGKNWQVMGAEPKLKSEFAPLGILKLFLEQVEVVSMSPDEILYSLPTIYCELPPVEHKPVPDGFVVIHEDEWRQFECLTTAYKAEIEREFAIIDAIYEEHSEGDGFNKIYLREGLDEPLKDCWITLDLLRTSFEIEEEYAGVVFKDGGGVITGSFAFYTRGWLLWGVADESESVTVLNIKQTPEFKLRRFADSMMMFLEENELYLVDWTVLYMGGSGKLDLRAYCEG